MIQAAQASPCLLPLDFPALSCTLTCLSPLPFPKQMSDPNLFPTTEFFTALQKRSESDTSVVATLRRSLMFEPGTDARAFPLIEGWISSDWTSSDWSDRRRRTVYLVAGLWAQVVRQGRGKCMSFPEAMRRVRDSEKSSSIEKRFAALLDADADDELRWRLRSALTLVASKGITLDWPCLLEDLLRWHYRGRRVQARWARTFWGSPPKATT